MNQQDQNSPSKPLEPVTFPDVYGGAVEVSGRPACDMANVFIHEEGVQPADRGIWLTSKDACDMALAILQAARPHLAWEVTRALGGLVSDAAWQRSQAYKPVDDAEMTAAGAEVDLEAAEMFLRERERGTQSDSFEEAMRDRMEAAGCSTIDEYVIWARGQVVGAYMCSAR